MLNFNSKTRQKINFYNINKELQKAKLQALYNQGDKIITDINKRTLKGVDVNLKAFESYNEKYKEYRVLKGRKSTVNLTFTGNMLGSMTYKKLKLKSGIRLYFGTAEESKKAYYVSKKRKFFGLDKRQKEKLFNKLKKAK